MTCVRWISEDIYFFNKVPHNSSKDKLARYNDLDGGHTYATLTVRFCELVAPAVFVLYIRENIILLVNKSKLYWSS